MGSKKLTSVPVSAAVFNTFCYCIVSTFMGCEQRGVFKLYFWLKNASCGAGKLYRVPSIYVLSLWTHLSVRIMVCKHTKGQV